jgi:peptidoglycan/xylan/chitin deacetylase (PgdA/CDA1 family)
MNFKKWIAAFILTCLAICVLFAAYNALIDPFGIFGDKLLRYPEYSMTQNPRIAKIAYLDKNYEKYDSYVIGCSKSSSLPTDSLNKYFSATFYNMIMYGGDLYDIEKTAEYIVNNYTAKNIVVLIGLEEARAFNTEADETKGNLHAKVDGSAIFPFYLKYLFLNPEYSKSKIESYLDRSYLISPDEVFVAQTGTYNKSKRDAERIPPLTAYLRENPNFTSATWYNTIPDADLCVQSIKRIKALCEDNGISFTLIACPVYEKELRCYNSEELLAYYKKIAEVTDFWNFSGYTDITYEPRYFYDSMHFRNCVGDMMLSKMFNDSSVYVPENFGDYITSENADRLLNKAFVPCEKPDGQSTSLAVLMYHHFTENKTDSSVSAERFDEQLTALENAGYTAVTLDELRAYVQKGTPLPEKPFLITVDDGYTSTLEVASPILEKHNASAVVSVIGCSIGKDTYKDTDIPITEHFALEEAHRYVENGTLTLISHTWDMHQVEHDGEGHREGVLQKEGESETEYLAVLQNDLEKMRLALGKVNALAYPYGKYSDLSEVFLSANGVDITFTTKWGNNEIVKGIPQTLRLLSRITVEENTTGEKLIEYIESAG